MDDASYALIFFFQKTPLLHGPDPFLFFFGNKKKKLLSYSLILYFLYGF